MLTNRQKKQLKQALANDNLAEVVAEIISDVGDDITSIESDITSLQAETSQVVGNSVIIESDPIYTISLEENVALLASALLLDAELFAQMNAHAADVAEHTTAADTDQFPLVEASSDIASLIDAVTEKLAAYVAHDADAKLAAAWVYHAGQFLDVSTDLVSAVAPTTLVECVARLNDLKAKYNAHEASAVSHGVGSSHTSIVADAAVGAEAFISIPGVLATDTILFSVVSSGTTPKTAVAIATVADGFEIEFDADLEGDEVIGYSIFREVA
jgi:hypothetical protein